MAVLLPLVLAVVVRVVLPGLAPTSSMQKGNPPPAYTHVMAHSPLTHSEETPSVKFPLRALLQAKTIKANRVQMFEHVLYWQL